MAGGGEPTARKLDTREEWVSGGKPFHKESAGKSIVASPPFSVVSVEGSSLLIPSASRVHIGTYYCIASNGVPPTKSKSIRLRVQCESRLPFKLMGRCHTAQSL